MDDLKFVKNVKFKELKRIDSVDYYKYAMIPYWMYAEAIFLSMDLDAFYGKNNDNNDKDVAKYATEFDFRSKLLDRALEINAIDVIGKAHLDKPWLIKFSPINFAAWAEINFPSFPPQLYEAVLKRHSPEKNNICSDSEYPSDSQDQELLAEAVKIIESSHQSKKKSDSLQARNASKVRENIQYAKIQAALHALLNMKRGCTCISRDLEKIVYNEIRDNVKALYPEINEARLKEYYIKEAVNLVMKTDVEAITRIFKLNDHWDNKWLNIQCEQPGHKR